MNKTARYQKIEELPFQVIKPVSIVSILLGYFLGEKGVFFRSLISQ